MAIRTGQLSFADQLKFGMLSKADQAKVLNCKSIQEASSMLADMKESVRFSLTSYEPKLQVSGSSVKYKTKNLFTEIFEEEDVKDFIALAEMSAMTEDEVVIGELKRKIGSMQKDGKQPLQCLVYATKQNEKVFYNNEKKVAVWAQVIADTVNSNPDNDVSILVWHSGQGIDVMFVVIHKPICCSTKRYLYFRSTHPVEERTFHKCIYYLLFHSLSL